MGIKLEDDQPEQFRFDTLPKSNILDIQGSLKKERLHRLIQPLKKDIYTILICGSITTSFFASGFGIKIEKKAKA